MGAAAIPLGMMVASQLFEGFTEKEAMDSAADADVENSRRTLLAGALEEEGIRRQGRAVQGEAISALAANGVSIGMGSAFDALHQNAIEIEYDALSRRFTAGSEAAGLRESARQKRKAGKYALFGGVLRAGATALSGGMDMKNAGALERANAATRAAQLPGGQSMPIPSHLVGPR